MAKYTGVSFDGVHSYEEWGLRLKSIDIGTPEAKTYYVDVPGRDGALDLTESMQDGVKYNNRVLTFVFDARHCSYDHWTGLLSVILEAIHGKKCAIVLDNDPGYYYEGRCSVNTQKSNEITAEITIECDCDPYKYELDASNEPWKWDPFSFVDGVAKDTADITIDSPNSWYEVTLSGKAWNETLTIIADAAMTLRYEGVEYEISQGTNYMTQFRLKEGTQYLYFKGTGSVTIVYRGGRL